MVSIRTAAFLALLGAFTAASLPARADQMSGMDMKARYSDAHVYTGSPNLPLTVSLVVAGGGPAKFDTTKLVGALAGPLAPAEVKSLTAKFGADNVTSFITVFDFVIADALKIAGEKKVALPDAPSVDPKDGKALSAALYTAGVTPAGRYDVEYMLDNLVSHGIHTQVMDDIDAKYGAPADANYHVVLTQAMTDLKAAYKL
ncbi:MAG: hypothetical protein JO225_09265 [Candidatus Eremiobacteraeota bacterium]|nr:hypothetical protein [Candidatus Eremiobacteraeota bacterium]MBV8644090.1 hypothetical protein [Candidatus Eremiobacteraeota bacterium]